MISYAIEASKECALVDRTIVSTDDEEIAKIARDYGAETPFLRPKGLSGDYANAEECLVHAVDWLKNNEDYLVDIVSYVQATDLFKKIYARAMHKRIVVGSCVRHSIRRLPAP